MRRTTRELPDNLWDLFTYNSKTGILTTNKNGRKSTKADHQGCLYVYIDCQRHLAHRVIWKMVYGDPVPYNISHLNGNKKDNRIGNIIDASKYYSMVKVS